MVRAKISYIALALYKFDIDIDIDNHRLTRIIYTLGLQFNAGTFLVIFSILKADHPLSVKNRTDFVNSDSSNPKPTIFRVTVYLFEVSPTR